MKKLISMLLIAFVVGDCIQLTRGVFKGSFWRVIEVNKDGTYDLKDSMDTLRNVRGSYLSPADGTYCGE